MSNRATSDETDYRDLGRNYRMTGAMSFHSQKRAKAPKQTQKRVSNSSKTPKSPSKEKEREVAKEPFSLGKYYRLGGAQDNQNQSSSDENNQSFSLGRSYRTGSVDQQPSPSKKADTSQLGQNYRLSNHNQSARHTDDEDLNQSTLGRSYRMSPSSPISREDTESPKEPFSLGRFYRTAEKRPVKSALPKPTKEASSTPQKQVKFLGVDYRVSGKKDSNPKDKDPLQLGRQYRTQPGNTQSAAYLLGKRYRLGGFPDDEEDDPLSDVNSNKTLRLKAKKH